MYEGPQDQRTMGKKQLGAEVDPETKKDVRMAAARRDISMADWLREAICEKLEREQENTEGKQRVPATAD